MILDKVENVARYAGVHKGIPTAVEAALKLDAATYQKGRVDVDGDNVYLNCAEYDTHDREGALSEAHRAYLDVMVMIDGCETVYVKRTDALRNVTKPYDASIDALLADTDSDVTAIRLEKGDFLVLFPEDAHAPGCHADAPCHVKKVIGKVKI
jgi:YhcH/YjgK/YiaL family protein